MISIAAPLTLLLWPKTKFLNIYNFSDILGIHTFLPSPDLSPEPKIYIFNCMLDVPQIPQSPHTQRHSLFTVDKSVPLALGKELSSTQLSKWTTWKAALTLAPCPTLIFSWSPSHADSSSSVSLKPIPSFYQPWHFLTSGLHDLE